MLAIKMRRVGKKHQASYRLVVMEKKSKLRGVFTEDLGFYNPHSKEAKIDGERVKHWMERGAQPTATVNNLLIKGRVIEGKKMRAHASLSKKAGEAAAGAEAKAESAAEPIAAEAPEAETQVVEAVENKENIEAPEAAKEEEVAPAEDTVASETVPAEPTKPTESAETLETKE